MSRTRHWRARDRSTGSSMVSVQKHMRGLTLVELMVAITLGLLILLAVVSIYSGSRQTYLMQEANARLQESGRYALEVMGRSIRQAGFWNMPINPVATATAFGGTTIAGTNGAAGAPDTITVQYDGLIGDRDCEGNVAANAVIQDAFRLFGADLQCDGNADGAVDHQSLVSDIEDVQVLYGVDNDSDVRQSVDQYVAAPANMALVRSAKVCVQVRSPTPVNNAPQRFLNCAGALGTAVAGADFTTAAAGDFRLRRVFVATYNIRNRVTSVLP